MWVLLWWARILSFCLLITLFFGSTRQTLEWVLKNLINYNNNQSIVQRKHYVLIWLDNWSCLFFIREKISIFQQAVWSGATGTDCTLSYPTPARSNCNVFPWQTKNFMSTQYDHVELWCVSWWNGTKCAKKQWFWFGLVDQQNPRESDFLLSSKTMIWIAVGY